jgi:ATP-dependent Clp protease ATP-binding subunit ClpC
LEDPLSEKLLFGDLKPGSIVVVDVEGDGDSREFTFTATPREPLPDSPPVEAAG